MPISPLYCQHCGRPYVPADVFRGASLSCAACGRQLGEQPPADPFVEPKDPFRGRRVAGAFLKTRLAVCPTRSVYAGRHEQLRRDVRVEVITGAFAENNEDFLRRLFAGAAHTHDLHCLHVATVYDLGRLPDCCYIISEELPDDLRGLLERKKRLPLRRSLRVAEEVLSGLQAVEAAGTGHGNVTPDGILFGRDGAARLCHLGTAMRPQDFRALTVTPRGMLAGPALYAAPERTASSQPDVRSDLYSLGCTLYQMLAGRPPVVGQSAEDVRRRHADGAAPGLAAECPDLPAPVGRYVARLMAVRPADRPPSAGAALDELHALVGELTAGGALPSTTGPRRKLFEATWTGTWTVVAILLLMATIAPFAIMIRNHRQRVAVEQAAAVHVPGAVAVLVRPQATGAAKPLSEQDALAVRTLLDYRLSFYSYSPAASPAGADRTLSASCTAGIGRRNWTLTFTDSGRSPWTRSAEAAVEQGAAEMAPLDAAARSLLRSATARLGGKAPNPADDAVVSASAEAWAHLGRALKAEATARWANAAAQAHAAGAPFTALADYYAAVRGAVETGHFPPPGPAPKAPTPPDLAGLDAMLRTISTGNADAVTAQFGDFLAEHPRSARGYFLLGLWRLKAAGQPDNAALALRHAAELNPSYRAAVKALTTPNTR